MAGRAYVGYSNFKIRPNCFYVESPVALGVTVDENHRDFSQANDVIYNLKAGNKVPCVAISGNVNTEESIKEGDYALKGGFLRTFVSGVNVSSSRAKPPLLEVYNMTSPYPISEGGMGYARQRLDGIVTANGSEALTGTGTDFVSTFNGNRPAITTGSRVIINGTSYTVATISSDTAMTVSANVPAGTYEVELADTIGDKEYISCLAYTEGGAVNWMEDFDGVDASISSKTTVTREGSNVVIRKGKPYIEAANRSSWASMVRDDNGEKIEDYNINHAIGACARIPANYTGGQGVNSYPAIGSEGAQNPFGGSGVQAGVINKGTPGYDVNLTRLADYRGRIYLSKEPFGGDGGWFSSPAGDYYRFIRLNGTLMDVGLSAHYADSAGVLQYDSTETLSIDPDNTVIATNNNTKIGKVYSTADLWNPFVATDTVPILRSVVDLSGDIVKSGASALHMYHIWGESPDNADIQKYLGPDKSLNPQTAYASVFNIPFPLTQDMSDVATGNHRQYYPYVALDMNINKLDPCVSIDIDNADGKLAFGGGASIYTSATYPSATTYGTGFGTTVQQQNAETLLRSVVITFSNYKPTDDMKTLDEFLHYGLDNFYGGSGTAGDVAHSGRIVGGICLMKYGINPDADIDAGSIYAQALPVMAQEDKSATLNAAYQMAHAVSGTGDGKLQQLFMRPTDLTNAAGTPRTVKIPMSEWFGIKTYIDVNARNSSKSANRNPYGNFSSTESSAVTMRVAFDLSTSASGSAGITPDQEIPFIDLKFPYADGNGNAHGPGTNTSGYMLNEDYDYGDHGTGKQPTYLYPNIMTIWVQNYRFVDSTEKFFKYGDNNIVDSSTNGAATETEVFVDNIRCVDFYQSFTNASATTDSSSTVSFPQKRTCYNPCQEIDPGGSAKMTSFNAGITTEANAVCTLQAHSPASYFSIGLNNKNDLPISGSSTSRRGYFLMNGFYTPDPTSLDQIVPNLYSGSFLSQTPTGATATSQKRNGLGFQGSNYASGTTNVNYSDPATSTSMYDVTGNQDITSKINVTTGSNNYMACDGFTQKGAFMASISGSQFTNWKKRENPMCSVKVVAVPSEANGMSSNQIQVSNTSFLTPDDPYSQYVVYIVGSLASGNNKGHRTFKLKNDGESIDTTGVITLDANVTHTDNGYRPLAVEGNLSKLYISPYKYWITLMTKGSSGFANRTYDSAALLNTNLSGATVSNIQGTTYNEVQYTYDTTQQTTIGQSAPYYQEWAFDMDPATETAIQLNVDYGYGAWDPETLKGGAVSRRVVQSGTFASLDIGPLVTSQAVGPDGDFTVIMKMPHESLGTSSLVLYGDEYAGTNSKQYKPTFIYEYVDDLPQLGNLKVTPAYNLLDKSVNPYKITDANLNALKFSWTEEGSDVWYRMLMTNENAAISNKYTNAKMWLPMNEAPTNLTTKPAMTVYNMINNTSGTAVVGDAILSYVDGISGYSPEVDAQTATLSGTIYVVPGTNTALHGLSEYTLVTHVTFDTTMDGVACDVLEQHASDNEFIRIHKNASNQIVYTHDTSSSTAITGSNFIVCDGITAYSIIITYKYQSQAGPDLQLFIDGNRSAYAADASEALDAAASAFTIAPFGASNKFKGRIEEIILYDKKYEVVSNPAEYVFSTADLADNDSTGKAINWSARLFNFDYHNIRGKTINDVARSNEVNWGATTL
jgi:hypothetical protein